MRPRDLLPWAYVLLLVGAVAFSMLSAQIAPRDDHFLYQAFIEKLAHGTLDLAIPGFHGMNILTVPWYWIRRSPLAQIEFQMLSGMLLPLFAFLAARGLFRSTWHGVVFATIIALMPFLSFSSLRGWMVAAYNVLFFLTIVLAAQRSRFTWIPFGFSVISLPFALALLPLLAVLTPPSSPLRQAQGDRVAVFWRYRQLFLGLAIPAVYVALQLLQTGRVGIGVHTEYTALGVWAGPERIFLNLAHTLQMLFSVHNYYFPDPALTAPGNLMHTTPVLIFLGLFALLAGREFIREQKLCIALLLGAIIGIGLNVVIDHMDHFYMETGIFFLILAALPILQRYPLWIPLALATLHFQWFYFFLQFQKPFGLTWAFFAVPALIDASFAFWCLVHPRQVQATLLAPWSADAH